LNFTSYTCTGDPSVSAAQIGAIVGGVIGGIFFIVIVVVFCTQCKNLCRNRSTVNSQVIKTQSLAMNFASSTVVVGEKVRHPMHVHELTKIPLAKNWQCDVCKVYTFNELNERCVCYACDWDVCVSCMRASVVTPLAPVMFPVAMVPLAPTQQQLQQAWTAPTSGQQLQGYAPTPGYAPAPGYAPGYGELNGYGSAPNYGAENNNYGAAPAPYNSAPEYSLGSNPQSQAAPYGSGPAYATTPM